MVVAFPELSSMVVAFPELLSMVVLSAAHVSRAAQFLVFGMFVEF
jgi:hypothetical protein